MWATANIRRWFTITRRRGNAPDQNSFSADTKVTYKLDAYPAYDSVLSPIRRASWSKSAVGRTQDGTSFKHAIPIRRAWERYWPISRNSMLWRSARANLALQARTCAAARSRLSRPVSDATTCLLTEDSAAIAAQERRRPSSCLHPEELGSAHALSRGWRSADRQQSHRTFAARYRRRPNNWTFLGSDRGGKTMAILRSFVSSCELNKVDPFAWFRDVLGRIATHSIQKLDELLPHNWAAVHLS